MTGLFKITILTVRFCKILIEKSEEKGKQMISKWKKKLRRASDRKCQKGIILRRRKNKRRRNLKALKGAEIYPNRVFYFLREKGFGKEKIIGKKLGYKKVLKVPSIFSISENPEGTIAFLQKLYYYGSRLDIKEIHIDHSECYCLEIAASTIMDVIVLAIKEYHRKNKKNIEFSGTIPAEGKVKDVFMASGLAAHMDLNMDAGILMNWHNIKRFKLISGYHYSQISDITATKLAEYIIECMNTQGYTLNGKGKNILGTLFGEVLDNCEIHGGEQTTWFALGHYQQNVRVDSYGEVQLVIFDFGNTIYEQLKEKTTSSKTREKLEFLSKEHEKFYNKNWTEEMLYTLFSRQEGISRLKDDKVEGNRRRGTGTVRLINNFQLIGQTNENKTPLMSITSGHTHICFDGTYKLKSQMVEDKELGNEQRRIIAFNDKNDIFQPPDGRYVKYINTFFPGTVISLKFYFDREYLTQIMESKR